MPAAVVEDHRSKRTEQGMGQISWNWSMAGVSSHSSIWSRLIPLAMGSADSKLDEAPYLLALGPQAQAIWRRIAG